MSVKITNINESTKTISAVRINKLDNLYKIYKIISIYLFQFI